MKARLTEPLPIVRCTVRWKLLVLGAVKQRRPAPLHRGPDCHCRATSSWGVGYQLFFRRTLMAEKQILFAYLCFLGDSWAFLMSDITLSLGHRLASSRSFEQNGLVSNSTAPAFIACTDIGILP